MDLAFTFRELSRQLVPGADGIELRIRADLRVRSRDLTVFEDDLFPVVDFAFASQAWAKNVRATPHDFTFGDRLAIRRIGKEWQIMGETFPLETIIEALDLFFISLREAISGAFGFDLDAFADRAERTPRSKLQ